MKKEIDEFTEEEEIESETDKICLGLLYEEIQTLRKKINKIGELVTNIEHDIKYKNCEEMEEKYKKDKEKAEDEIIEVSDEKEFIWRKRHDNMEFFLWWLGDMRWNIIQEKA